MPARKLPGYKLTQKDYAYVYGVHPNTIVRWKRRKLPLDDPARLIPMLLQQHTYSNAALDTDIERVKDDHEFLCRNTRKT